MKGLLARSDDLGHSVQNAADRTLPRRSSHDGAGQPPTPVHVTARQERQPQIVSG